MLLQTANAVDRLPFDNWVNPGPTSHSSQYLVTDLPHLTGLPMPFQTDNTGSPLVDRLPVGGPHRVDSVSVLTLTSLHTCLLLVAYLRLEFCLMVSHARSLCLVAVMAACMSGPHTINSHITSSTHALTGAQRNWPVH